VCTPSLEGQGAAVEHGADNGEGASLTTLQDASSALPHARISVSRDDLIKKMRQFNWTVRSSTEGVNTRRIYFKCVCNTCKEIIKAHQISDKGVDDEWAIYGAHANHTCGGGVRNVAFNGMYCLKDSLPAEVCAEIEYLGASGAFDSPSIQKHLLSKNPNMLVDTRLIQNMAYRVKQKLFGSKGDIIHLLEQQKVDFDQVCTHFAL
jgi:hypothetical protein